MVTQKFSSVCNCGVCGPYVAETHTCGLFLWCWWSSDIHSKVEFYDISSMIKHARVGLTMTLYKPPISGLEDHTQLMGRLF